VVDSPTDGEPFHSIVDLTAGWFGTQQVGSLVRYPLLGSIAEGSVDNRIPSSATTRLGRSFPKGIDNPSRWLIGKYGESVPMSSVGLAVHVLVVNEEFGSVAAVTSQHSLGFLRPQR
jgi:hypothetical protein